MCDTDVSQLEDHPIGTFSTVMKERERERDFWRAASLIHISCCEFLFKLMMEMVSPSPPLTPPQHRLDTMNSVWVSQMEAEGGIYRQRSEQRRSAGVSCTVETDPSYSTWWNYRVRILVPRACFLMWTQSDLLRWFYRMFHLATSVPEARISRPGAGDVCRVITGLRREITRQRPPAIQPLSDSLVLSELLLIHVSVLTNDQSHSVGSHSTVWLHIFNLCFKTRVENAKNQLI